MFPPRVEEVISQKVTESYVNGNIVHFDWNEVMDRHAQKYDFKVGDAIHIPFTSGHYVKNGTEDISITLSVFFHTEETLEWTKAMKFNHHVRRLGVSLRSIGYSSIIDSAKANLFPVIDLAKLFVSKVTWKVMAIATGLVNLLLITESYLDLL